MPAIPAGTLQKGHQVVQHDGTVKVVLKTETVKPECIAETFVIYTDDSTDQWCDFKNITVLVEMIAQPRKAK